MPFMRLQDPHGVVRKSVYFPDFNGSFSINETIIAKRTLTEADDLPVGRTIHAYSFWRASKPEQGTRPSKLEGVR
jgi:hypothetical protein